MKLLKIGLLLATAIATWAVADDTELFVTEISARTGYRPQVLVIFDNSGSMASTLTVKVPYNPDIKYAASGPTHSTWAVGEKAKDPIYWASGGFDNAGPPTPTGPSDWNRFEYMLLNCQAARDVLFTQGFFTGYLRQYGFKGSSGSWQEFPNNSGLNADHPIDCYEDIINNDARNPGQIKKGSSFSPAPAGLPVNGAGSKGSPQYWSDTTPYVNNTEFGTGQVVTLYTSNYLRWYHNATAGNEVKSRLDVAKEATNSVVSSTLVADFGLMIFNRNGNSDTKSTTRHGGRVVKGIPKEAMTAAQRQSLTDVIDSLDAETWTPLCETLYEAYRYFSGSSVLYGKADTGHLPKRDTTIESGSNYIPPFKDKCAGDVYVILVTDGAPTIDENANPAIKALPGIGAPFKIRETVYRDSQFTTTYDNYLAALAGWMYSNDINSNIAGKQKATTFTIGFGDAFADASQPATKLLVQTAANGGGKYYKADSADSLTFALQSALTEILNIDASITSPAVATNAFDRTQILDNLYYAVFKASKTTRWRGNLKKLKLSGDNVLDQNGNNALSVDGGISEGAKTYWTSAASSDGASTEKGGVVEMLASLSSRKLLFNHGTTLKSLDVANLGAAAGSSAALATHLGVEATAVNQQVDFIRGRDIDDDDGDGNSSENRSDLFGDPMHSRPVVINYGGSSDASQDLRVLVGTNAGFLHMFQDKGNSVTESWAFMPWELLPKSKPLRDNFTSSVKVYGMDGTPAIYRDDTNFNGKVDSGEKVWLFTGMRRGGHSYYALNLSNPDSPQMMWKIGPEKPGFEDLGESWSRPTIGFIRKNGANKPVLFFGGGYDPAKEAKDLAKPDSVGAAVFIVDAESGALIQRFSASSTAINNTALAIRHGVAGDIAIVDADADGFVDRLYAADTGGNVWRIDMPDAEIANWSGYQFAQLSAATTADDRRFFVRPVVSRSFETRYTLAEGATGTTDAVYVSKRDTDYLVIGSGNFGHPLDRQTDDHYFILKDYQITPRQKDAEVPAPILVSQLFDLKAAMAAAAGTADDAQLLQLQATYGNYRGCYVPHGGGEKVLAPGRILSGNTLWSTFTPADEDMDEQCRPSIGTSVLYNTRMCDVAAEIYSETIGYLPLTDAPTIIPPQRVPEVPPEDGEEDETAPSENDDGVKVLLPDGVHDPCQNGACEGFNRVLKHYSVQTEQQQ